jgi:type I restriction enzyme S subunit
LKGHPKKKLGDFCRTGSGGTPSRGDFQRYYEGGDIPWVKSGELREGLITSTEEHVTKEALSKTSIKLVPPGAILLAMYGATVGRLAILGVEAATNQAICHIVPNPDEADTRYLYYALSDQVPEIIAMGVGGAQPNISQGLIKELRIPLPPLAEQRRIAAILDQADALRAKRRESLAQLETLKQSIFLDMFGDPVFNARRFPTHPIKDLARIVTGRTPPSSKDGMFNGSVPFITPGDLESDRPISRFLTTNGVMFSETVRKGSTLVCCIGATIGKMGQAGSQCAFNQQINAIEWNSQILDDYGFAVFGFFKKNIASWGTSTTLPILKKSSFEQIEIPVVPIEQQKTFSMALSSVRIVESQSKQSLLETENLFASLQHRAFRGEL